MDVDSLSKMSTARMSLRSLVGNVALETTTLKGFIFPVESA
jgi:hypothetical protein